MKSLLLALELMGVWLAIAAGGCARPAPTSSVEESDEDPAWRIGEQGPGPAEFAFRDEKNGGRYGYIDRRGTVVIEPQFEHALDFADGLAQVWRRDRIEFIGPNCATRFSLPPDADLVRGPAEGMIWFRTSRDSRWGLFDEQGAVILEPKYDNVEVFSDGLAAVNIGAKLDMTFRPPWLRGGKWGYIDRLGKQVIPVSFARAGSFSGGRALVGSDAGEQFIDKEGKVVISISGSGAGDFREGLAAVHSDAGVTRYIDNAGKVKFEVRGYGHEFHEGLAVVGVPAVGQDGFPSSKYGFIDKEGKIVIDARFAEASHFSDGLAAICIERPTGGPSGGDRWAYVDKSGRVRIDANFNEAGPFRNGVARVHVGGELRTEMTHMPPVWRGGEWWFIDDSGKKLHRF
jgi:hypothetical protein